MHNKSMTMFRKGQNYRIFIAGKVVVEETSCTVTRGVDTQDAANKDTTYDSTVAGIGGAYPAATFKNMQFQVEAQGVGAKNLFQMAFAMMNATGGPIGWAETSGAEIQGKHNREGTPTYVIAICNDLTINAPNRQPITCSAQFTVIPGTPPEIPTVTAAAATRPVLNGEFLRLFLGNRVVAKATNVSVHYSLSLEDETTKDVTSSGAGRIDYKAQAPTQLNYDITSECLYDGGLDSLTEGDEYDWELSDASGDGQATEGQVLCGGTAMLTSLVANAPVNQNVTYSATFTGIGA